jgi:hypothetical protein
MASILDMYKKSDFNKLPDKSKDKTPIEADGGPDLSKNESALEKARGGKLNERKYTDSKPQ